MIRIKEIRKLKKITAKELAEQVNVAESTMSLYENGKREPDFETLSKIARYLEVSTDYLLGLSKNSALTEQKEKPSPEGESLEEDVIIVHRDGKTTVRKYTKAQLDAIEAILNQIGDSES